MPVIVRGDSVLISSATASGKTEAVFAPLYQRHVTFARTKLSVVYIAPTKALVNDMFERLMTYFGNSSPDIVQRYTGDHHDFHDPKGRFVLLATPEALDSLQLMRPDSLSGVRAVICDELHLLQGSARGQQLRAVIARIRTSATVPQDPRDRFQHVAMTATMHDQAAVAEKWFGPDTQLVREVSQRPIEMDVLRTSAASAARLIADKLRSSPFHKVLIFSNTRNGAHVLAAKLVDDLQHDRWTVVLHIGILSRTEREQVEQTMRRESRVVCVATSTLEVGIDIGDIDLVILEAPPSSISAFLQRIGRGNRRSERSIVWAIARTDDDVSTFRALLHCAAKGDIDEQHEYDRPSVQFQQLLSLAWAGTRADAPLTLANFGHRTGGSVDVEVINDMLDTGVLQNIRGALVPADKWMDHGDQRRIHTVIAGGGGLALVDSTTGEALASVDSGIELEGAIYAGSRFKNLYAKDEAAAYARVGRRGTALAKLPSSRSRFRGHSRQLAAAIGTLSGYDPLLWKREGGRIVTWGGDAYNTLIVALLHHSSDFKNLVADAFGITGFPDGPFVSPSYVAALAERARTSESTAIRMLPGFREATPYFSALSRSLQQKETRAAVPWIGFIRWLQECVASDPL